jgi:hypothetical protein
MRIVADTFSRSEPKPDGILATRHAQIIAPPPTRPRCPDARQTESNTEPAGQSWPQNARLLTPAVWQRLSERAAWRQAIFAPPVSDCRVHLAVTLRWSSLAIGWSGMGGNVEGCPVTTASHATSTSRDGASGRVLLTPTRLSAGCGSDLADR